MSRRAVLEDLWARLDAGPLPGEPTRHGTTSGLSSPLPVDALAVGAVEAAGVAAAAFLGVDPATVTVDTARVGSSFRADRLLRVRGERPAAFAPLSGFFPTGDGWVRTHANYPWHADALRRALGTGDVPAALLERTALDVEEAVTAAGGLAVAVRDRGEWARHPQGAAVAAEPLVSVRRTGEPGGPAPRHPRVLDLTRVIAGPVATRFLALCGADVLRLDPPHRPDLPAQLVDTGIGKRSAVLDAAAEPDRLGALVDAADVVVLGYRPGALDRLGLGADALLDRRRDLVVVRLDAWGWTGPWSGRRGFDSIVQAACGIARTVGGAPPAPPGALPAQALDHATGYLAAASALLGLAERASRGGTVRDLALARTAEWLHGGGRTDPGPAGPPVEDVLQTLGEAELPPPPLRLPGGADRWSAPAPAPSSSASWLSASWRWAPRASG